MSLLPLEHIEAQDPQFALIRRRIISRFVLWSVLILIGLFIAAPIALVIAPIAIGWILLDTMLLLYHRNQIENFHHYRQIEALTSLHNLIDVRYPLPPMRLWVISPDFALLIATLIKQHKPAHIVEFGSGASTLIAAYMLEQNGAGKITSFEHLEAFADASLNKLKLHSLKDYANVIHAPLTAYAMDHGEEAIERKWYDTQMMHNLPNIDLLIVDGPPAKTAPLARYPVLPVLFDWLNPGALILVDDYMRADDHVMVNHWLDEFSLEVVETIANEKGAIILRKATEQSHPDVTQVQTTKEAELAN